MGERKVLNKYYPPDFDATKLPRNRKPIDRQETVRTMLPMNIQCMSCGEFMYSGKKFNSKKELAIGEDYLGIKVWRFYIKCVMCSSEITFKTDPKNGNYVVERGAKRNFEPWTAAIQADKDLEERIKEEEQDAMKALENRQKEAKREMDQMDALQELQAMSRRHSQRRPEELLLLHQRKYESTVMQKQEEEDESTVRSIFGDKHERVIRRIDDDDGKVDGKETLFSNVNVIAETANNTDPVSVVVKRKRKSPDPKISDSTPNDTKTASSEVSQSAKKLNIVSYSDSESDS